MHDRTSQPVTRGGIGSLVRLIWPVFIEQVLMMTVLVSDMMLAGFYLSREHLSAMTSMSYVMWLMSCLFSVVALGVAALVARDIGAGDPRSAARATNQALVAGAAMAVALTLAIWPWDDWLERMMRLDGDTARHFTRFLALLTPALPAMMVEQVGLAGLRGAGDMIASLITMTLVNVVNLAVSWPLLLGVGPIPPLGWDAIALGAVAGHATGALVTLLLLARGRGGLALRLDDMRPDANLIRRILKVGVPGGVDMIGQTFLQLYFLSMINELGDLAAAAHGVAIRIESLVNLVAVAFQVAAGTLAGQYLGAGDRAGAARNVWLTCAAGAIVMLAASVLLYLGAGASTHLFLSDEHRRVSELAAPLLRIISLALVPLAVLNVLGGALRGAGDTRWPLAVTLIGFIGVRIPLAHWLMFVQAEGVKGAWHAMAVDLFVRCALITLRFVHGGWQRTQV